MTTINIRLITPTCWSIKTELEDKMFLLEILWSMGIATIYDRVFNEIRIDPLTASERAMFESLIPEGFEVEYV
jgi:hypothetical protein